jgi:hypothetical protein
MLSVRTLTTHGMTSSVTRTTASRRTSGWAWVPVRTGQAKALAAATLASRRGEDNTRCMYIMPTRHGWKMFMTRPRPRASVPEQAEKATIRAGADKPQPNFHHEEHESTKRNLPDGLSQNFMSFESFKSFKSFESW